MRLVRAQLEKLSELQQLRASEGVPKEEAWRQVTDALLQRAFASNSPILDAFSWARSKGTYNIMGVSPAQHESNFRARLQGYESALNAAIADLEMSMPEQAAGIYEANDPFSFYNDLRDILSRALREVFIVDAYIDRSLFDLYLCHIQKSISLRVLSSNLSQTTVTVAQLFAASYNSFELRTSQSLHDRVVFVDDRCWVAGQSLKDAAVKKPTYMVEISSNGMRTPYEHLWNSATTLVKN